MLLAGILFGNPMLRPSFFNEFQMKMLKVGALGVFVAGMIAILVAEIRQKRENSKN